MIHNQAYLDNSENLEGSCANAPLLGEILHMEADAPMYICVPNIVWVRIFCLLSPFSGIKPQILHFQLWHPMVVTPNDVDRKLNVGIQLQTFLFNNIKTTSMSSSSVITDRHFRLASKRSFQQFAGWKRFVTIVNTEA